MATEDEFAPCRFGAHDDGTYTLAFDDFAATAGTFEEMGQDGGGYGWHGVVDALVRMEAPRLRKKLDYDPEASLFVVLSKDRDALKQVAGLIREAIADPTLLRGSARERRPGPDGLSGVEAGVRGATDAESRTHQNLPLNRWVRILARPPAPG